MRLTTTFIALAVLVTSALTAPATILHDVERHDGAIPGRYIVTFQPGFNKTSVQPESGITHTWNGDINGFAGHFDDAAIEELRTNPHVQTITEDGVAHAFITQTNAPWGLGRLSSTTRLANQDPTAKTFSYTYDASAGAGVDIYVIDSGVRTTHAEFGGRARWGATFGPYPDVDDNGHGTHCAGTAAGINSGVAKAANIIAVKVLGADNKGWNSDFISGFNWILYEAGRAGRPAVVSASLGSAGSTAIDNAVAALTAAGIHVVVAAGNDAADAGNTSPARAPSVITVGATNITDGLAWFSNFGSVVDIFAPGDTVISAWPTSDSSYHTLSGTSMATPHVAGLVAYLTRLEGLALPVVMSRKLQMYSLKSVIGNLPPGTVNYLAHII